MKIGFCLNMVSRESDGTGMERIPELRELGFDYAELPVAEMLRLDKRTLARLRRELESGGLPCLSCNNLFPKEVRLTGPEADMERIKLHARDALSLAGSLGAKTVVFGSGAARSVPEGFSMERAYEQLVEALRGIDPIAGEEGVTLVLEAARRQDTNIILCYEQACRWLADSGAEHAGVMLDFFHEASEDPTLESIRNLRRAPDHIHIACPQDKNKKWRRIPCREDGYDYGLLFDALGACGYDKLMSVEAYTDDFIKDAAAAPDFLRAGPAGARGN